MAEHLEEESSEVITYEELQSDIQCGLKELLEAHPDYHEAERYAEGNVEQKYTTPALQKLLTGSEHEFNINLCRRVITAVTDRLEISAVTAKENRGTEYSLKEQSDNMGGSGSAVSGGESILRKKERAFDEDVTRILNEDVWHKNELDIEAPDIHNKAGKYGDAYLFVWEDDEGGVDVFYNSPLTTRVFYDPENPRIKKFAIKRWRIKVGGAKKDERVRMDVYYPDFFVRYVSKNAKGERFNDFVAIVDENSDENGFVPHPYGQIPIFHFRTERPYGTPEHKQGYGPQDAINKLVLAQMTTVDFASFPQRWATSTKDTNTDTDIDWGDDDTRSPEDAQSNLVSGPGRVWLLDNIDKVGQFPAADADQFLKPLDKFIELMAAATSTPLSYLHKVRGTSSTPLSGASQKQTDGILLKKVDARKRSYGATWREALQFAMSILGYEGIIVNIDWGDSQVDSSKDTWDGVLLQQKAGVTKRQTLLEQGYTVPEVESFGFTEDEPNGPPELMNPFLANQMAPPPPEMEATQLDPGENDPADKLGVEAKER